MADIFLSYSRDDQATARRFAEGFERAGFTVWWDATLDAGQAYDEVTEKALQEAKAVVVLWSKTSVASRWVRAEATQADRNKTLIPVMIEPCTRPIMFELTHTADLSHWTGDESDKACHSYLDGLRRFVEKGPLGPQLPAAASQSRRRIPDASRTTDSAVARLPSIAVLPFANMSGDKEQEYFSDGISEDIITDLSKVSALSVISRNSSFTFKGRHVDLPQVAQTLKVSHILEGSVRKSGNRVRITAQLIDGATNEHVWADRYDRNLDDIFALQDEISKAIVAALKLKLFPEEQKAIEDRGTTNTEAYDLCLRARALARTFAPLEILRAIEIYRQALVLDPNFALAWAGLASALERALLNAPETQAETRKAMDDAFSRALALDPDGWTSKLARAAQLFARRDWAAAEHAFMRAIELAPASEPSVRMRYGAFLMHIGRVRESVDLLQAARRAEPLSLEVSTLLQIALDNAGMRAEALTEFERSKDLAGDRAMLEYFAILRLLEHDDAARIKQQFIRFLSIESLILPVHQEMREVLNQPEAVLALLRRAHDDPAYQDSTRQTILAEWAAHYGDFDLAFAAFRRALIDLTSTWYADFWRPHYAVALRDPRFKSLLRDLGLIDYYRSSGKWPDLLRPVGEVDFECH